MIIGNKKGFGFTPNKRFGYLPLGSLITNKHVKLFKEKYNWTSDLMVKILHFDFEFLSWIFPYA